jgi:hypothetical protein
MNFGVPTAFGRTRGHLETGEEISDEFQPVQEGVTVSIFADLNRSEDGGLETHRVEKEM